VPRDWFLAEDKYLTEIGVRINLGTKTNTPDIHELRLYLQEVNKNERKEIINDLKSITVYPAIMGFWNCNLHLSQFIC